MRLLRVTHMELAEDEEGWYIRFTGEDDIFNRMRNDLKMQPRYAAKWLPAIEWPDGKKGAWFVDSDILTLYSIRFSNLLAMMDTATKEAATRKREDASRYTYTRREHVRREDTTTSQVYIPPHVFNALKVLGLPTNKLPTKDELKKAYHKMCLKYHPDIAGPGSEETSKRINTANDDVKRWLATTNMVNTSWPGRSA